MSPRGLEQVFVDIPIRGEAGAVTRHSSDAGVAGLPSSIPGDYLLGAPGLLGFSQFFDVQSLSKVSDFEGVLVYESVAEVELTFDVYADVSPAEATAVFHLLV